MHVLLPGHLPQGRAESPDLVEGSVTFCGEPGDLGAGLGKFGVLPFEPGGQVPDPGSGSPSTATRFRTGTAPARRVAVVLAVPGEPRQLAWSRAWPGG